MSPDGKWIAFLSTPEDRPTGKITRLSDKSVQLQIADKVRIEVARASVGGYQGQDPVVPESGNA